MASPENRQTAMPVLDHEVELGCVFYAKELKYTNREAECIKAGCPLGCKLDERGHGHPATIVGMDKSSGTTMLKFVQRKMTSNWEPSLGRQSPVTSYTLQSGKLREGTVFLIDHIYTLPLTSFGHVWGDKDGRGAVPKFDEESLKKLELELNWSKSTQVHETDQSLGGAPAQQPPVNTLPQTEHPQADTSDSTISEDANPQQLNDDLGQAQQAINDRTIVDDVGTPEAEVATEGNEAALPSTELARSTPSDVAEQDEQASLAETATSLLPSGPCGLGKFFRRMVKKVSGGRAWNRLFRRRGQ